MGLALEAVNVEPRVIRDAWVVYRREAFGDVLVEVRTSPPSLRAVVATSAPQTIVRRWSRFTVQSWMVAQGIVR